MHNTQTNNYRNRHDRANYNQNDKSNAPIITIHKTMPKYIKLILMTSNLLMIMM